MSPDEALKQKLRCSNPACRRTDDLPVRIYNTVSGLTRNGNSMAYLLLALLSTMSSITQDNASSELLEASLQALGSMAFSSGKALGLVPQARRQVWLAQSRLPEVHLSPVRNRRTLVQCEVQWRSLSLGAETGLSVQMIARSVWCWTSCNICWMLDYLQQHLGSVSPPEPGGLGINRCE